MIDLESNKNKIALAFKNRLKRAQSSKPLRVSLKDLECVKKLKEKSNTR